MINYTHTQHVPAEAMVVISGIVGLSTLLVPGRLLKGLTALGLGGLVYTFSSMTINIDAECIQIKYGDWLTVKKILLSDIVAYQPARMNAANGWGIHFIGAGWLYNIYGLDAVEVTLSSGEKLFIGTDEPEGLRDAIAYARMPVA